MEKLDGHIITNELLFKLERVGVLLFQEFPSTIVFKSENNDIYIQEWVDCSEDGSVDRYFLFHSSKLFLAKFLKNEISHADFVLNSIDGFAFFYDQDRTSTSDLTIISTKNIPFRYMPSSDQIELSNDFVDIQNIKLFIDFDNITTSTNLETHLIDEVETRKIDIYNLHLIKGEGIGFGSINTQVLSNTLKEFDNLYKNIALDIHIGKSRGKITLKKHDVEKYTSTEVVRTLAASFSIFIKPSYSEYLLFDNLTSSETIADSVFTLLNNSIETKNFQEIYSTFSENTISAYKNLLEEIYSNNIVLDISFLSKSNSKQYNQMYDIKLANKIIDDINNFSFSEEDSFEKIGKFRAVNCDTGHFTFVSKEDESFSGYMDKLIKEGSERIVFTQLYLISINRKITKEASKEKPKIDDTLIAFYEYTE